MPNATFFSPMDCGHVAALAGQTLFCPTCGSFWTNSDRHPRDGHPARGRSSRGAKYAYLRLGDPCNKRPQTSATLRKSPQVYVDRHRVIILNNRGSYATFEP